MKTNTGTRKTKRIGGKVYSLHKSYNSKYDAQERATRLRKRGRSARIIERDVAVNPYALYVR